MYNPVDYLIVLVCYSHPKEEFDTWKRNVNQSGYYKNRGVSIMGNKTKTDGGHSSWPTNMF